MLSANLPPTPRLHHVMSNGGVCPANTLCVCDGCCLALLLSCPVSLYFKEHDELVELLTSDEARFSPYQAAWLKALTTTTAADDAEAALHSTTSSKLRQEEQPTVPDLLPPAGEQYQYPCEQQGFQFLNPEAEIDRQFCSFNGLGMDEEKLWAAVGELAQSLAAV